MQLNMKPLKGDKFTVEIDPELKVIDLKNKVAELKSEYPAASQKLIYSGKILADDSVIKTLDIKDDGFIVVMVTKAAGAAAAPAAEAAPAARALAMLSAPPPQLPQVIMDLKQSPRFKELTMVIMRSPQVLERMLPALRQQWPQLLTALTENMEGFMTWMEQEATQQAMASAVTASNPNIPPELAQAIQQNPQALAALLQRAGQSGGLPGIAGAGGAPPAAGGAPAAAAPGGPGNMTPEDEAAVGRMTSMGFERTMCLQAYFACDKNEEMAVNFLLSGDDMEM